MNIREMARIARAYGHVVESHRESATPDAEYDDIMAAEFSLYRDCATGKTDVVMWVGSYPFANDVEMGTMTTYEDAVRYVTWLLKREAFYQERDEARWRDLECDGCDQDPWRKPVHYGSCPLAVK